MTTTETSPSPTPAEGEATLAEKRRRVIGALRHAIMEADAGTVAALRRMDPDSPAPAFYRLATALLDGIAPASGPPRDEAERRWAVIARAIAIGEGMLGGVRFGAALALAKVAELRVLRLLEARGGQLADALFGVLHQLASKGQVWSPYDVAALVLSDGGPDQETVRRSVARDFYRNE